MKIKDTMEIIHKKRKLNWKKKIHNSTIYLYLRKWISIDYLLNMKWGRGGFNSHTRLWQYILTDRDFDRIKYYLEKWYKLKDISEQFWVSQGYFYNHKKRLWLI